MAVGADNTGTATRESLLRGRGYSEAVIAANGNGNHRPEVDTPAPAPVEELPAEAVDPLERAPSCSLVDCVEPLPPGRRAYCSAEHATEAERRRSRARAHQEAEKRAAARAARPPGPSALPAKAPPDLDDEHQVDEHPRASVGQLATEILAAGYGVEVTIDGATLVARGRR